MNNLQQILNEYKVPATVVDKTEGSRITLYEIKLHAGVRKLTITRNLDEIGVLLGAESIRLITIPENNAFGLEVSNRSTKTVKIKDVFQSDEFKLSNRKLKFVIGESPDGKKVVGSMVDAKHLLIGGTTGSGKSVFINTLLVSLLKESPINLRMILIDPKRIELSGYEDIPHLLAPVIKEPEQAEMALEWVNQEMTRRYKILELIAKTSGRAKFGDIDEYDRYLNDIYITLKAGGDQDAEKTMQYKIPHIVVVIDELAQLLMTQPSETWSAKGSITSRMKGTTIEQSIIKIAQLGRAAGIHLVVATQRPSADVITPLIKANLPTKIAFAVPTVGNSKVILDRVGAEKLLGRGDMLYMQEDDINPRRVQGAYVGSEDIERVLSSIRENNSPPVFDKEIMKMLSNGVRRSGSFGAYQPLVDEVSRKKRRSINVDKEADEFHELYILNDLTSSMMIDNSLEKIVGAENKTQIMFGYDDLTEEGFTVDEIAIMDDEELEDESENI